MTEQQVEELRSNVDKKRKYKEEFIKIKKELQELEKEQIIKKYTNLKQKESKLTSDLNRINKDIQNIDDDQILNYELKKLNTNSMDTIYLYLGTYHESIIDYKVDKKDKKADYNKYLDLLRSQVLLMPIKDCEEFEKTYNVIILDKSFKKNEEINNFRTDFIKSIIDIGEEETCKKVRKKYKKDIKTLTK